MLKVLGLISIFIFCQIGLAKDLTLEVLAKKSDITEGMDLDQTLMLNGFRQAVTAELLELKLDSTLYWTKLDKKKFTKLEELKFLKSFFDKELLARASQGDAAKESPKEAPVNESATLTASIDLDKLKSSYEEIISDLEETKFKTFYLLPTIEIDKSMSWDDVGVQKAESFSGVIIDSWKKLIEKEITGFEKIVVLDKDFATKPNYMNPKSVILKWNSTIKKAALGSDSSIANYELSAQYVIQNTKTGTLLTAMDFPLQKRTLDGKNKKALSSSLASLVYNLLFSQVSKIQGLLEADAKTIVTSELEIVVLKAGLSEIFQVNNLLQEKFKDLKLTSQMKSYSSNGTSIIIRAEAPVETILDSLSKEGGKYPLNEQNILLFNRADKTFAIIPKESNN